MGKLQKIVHVVQGNSTISWLIIENVLRDSEFESFFIVTKGADVAQFKEIFGRFGSVNYILCDEVKLSRISRVLIKMGSLLTSRCSSLFTTFPGEEIKALLKFRKEPILLHGVSFNRAVHLLLLNHFRSLSYVCWGSVPSPVGKRIKDKISFALQRHIVRKYKRIVCLMTADQLDYERVFGITTATTIIYQPGDLANDDPSELVAQPQIGKRSVLLGNSACYTDSYLEILPSLERMAAAISITCMLSYPEDDPRGQKKAVIEKYASVFGNNFTPWTRQLDMAGYYARMKTHDIYICNVERQAGLGAIYTMLMYGKKLYLTGKNLAWIRENNFIVYDVGQIATESEKAFLSLLSLEEKRHNHDRLLDMLSPVKIAKEWDHLYSQLG